MFTSQLMNRRQTVIKGDSMDESKEGLKACAEEILKAVHSADASALEEALESFFYLCDAMPHEEGPSLSHGGTIEDHLSRGMEGISDQRRQARRFGEG